MAFLYNLMLFLHLVSWAIILGGWLATMKKPGLYAGIPHAALTALITGVLMVGISEMNTDAPIDHMKIGIKLLVTLAVVVLAFMAKKKGDDAPRGWITAIGALTVVNIAIALFWSGRHIIG